MVGFTTIVLVGWLFAQGVPVPGTQHITVQNNVTLQAPAMNPQAVSDASVIADQAFIVSVAQPVPVAWVNQMCSLPDIWRTTPPGLTYQNASIASLANKITTATSVGLLALAFLAAGAARVFGQPLEFGRVIFAFVLSFGNLTWWQMGVDANNALTATIGAPDLCSSLISPHLQLQMPNLSSTGAVPTAVAGAVLVIVYAVVSLLLLVSLAFRLGVLDILIAAGGLAGLCWATRWSQPVAQWYSRLAVGTLFGQVLLVIGLEVARVLNGLGSGLAGVLLGIVVLLICRSLLGALTSERHQVSGASTGFALVTAARRLAFRR